MFWSYTSVLGLGVGYIVMATTSDRMIAFGAFAFNIITSGCIIMGVVKCLQLRCQQHAHFAVSVVSLITYCVQFLAPLGVGFVCSDNTPEQVSLEKSLVILIKKKISNSIDLFCFSVVSSILHNNSDFGPDKCSIRFFHNTRSCGIHEEKRNEKDK